MATTLQGTRFPRSLDVDDNKPNGYVVAMPYLLKGGVYRFPEGSLEFFNQVDTTLVVGTPTVLVATVTGYMAALQGLIVSFDSTTDWVVVERTNGVDLFKANNGFIGKLSLIFTPELFFPATNEGGIQLLQTSGTAARVVAAAWGYHIPV